MQFLQLSIRISVPVGKDDGDTLVIFIPKEQQLLLPAPK